MKGKSKKKSRLERKMETILAVTAVGMVLMISVIEYLDEKKRQDMPE